MINNKITLLMKKEKIPRKSNNLKNMEMQMTILKRSNSSYRNTKIRISGMKIHQI